MPRIFPMLGKPLPLSSILSLEDIILPVKLWEKSEPLHNNGTSLSARNFTILISAVSLVHSIMHVGALLLNYYINMFINMLCDQSDSREEEFMLVYSSMGRSWSRVGSYGTQEVAGAGHTGTTTSTMTATQGPRLQP